MHDTPLAAYCWPFIESSTPSSRRAVDRRITRGGSSPKLSRESRAAQHAWGSNPGRAVLLLMDIRTRAHVRAAAEEHDADDEIVHKPVAMRGQRPAVSSASFMACVGVEAASTASRT